MCTVTVVTSRGACGDRTPANENPATAVPTTATQISSTTTKRRIRGPLLTETPGRCPIVAMLTGKRERVDAVTVREGTGRPDPATGVDGDVLPTVAAEIRGGRRFDSGIRLEAPEFVPGHRVVRDERVRQ